jgi:small subunit ribosomal protein S9
MINSDATTTAPVSLGTAAPSGDPTMVRRSMRDAHWHWGIGRRKTAVARVRIRPGTGKITINGRPYDEFFCVERDRSDVMSVLQKTSMTDSVDVFAKIEGGGITGQAGAMLLGLARALANYDPNLYGALREEHFLSRDSRKVERKKYGQAGARRRFQFSKR